jgi:hypothetical protein
MYWFFYFLTKMCLILYIRKKRYCLPLIWKIIFLKIEISFFNLSFFILKIYHFFFCFGKSGLENISFSLYLKCFYFIFCWKKNKGFKMFSFIKKPWKNMLWQSIYFYTVCVRHLWTPRIRVCRSPKKSSKSYA